MEDTDPLLNLFSLKRKSDADELEIFTKLFSKPTLTRHNLKRKAVRYHQNTESFWEKRRNIFVDFATEAKLQKA